MSPPMTTGPWEASEFVSWTRMSIPAPYCWARVRAGLPCWRGNLCGLVMWCVAMTETTAPSLLRCSITQVAYRSQVRGSPLK